MKISNILNGFAVAGLLSIALFTTSCSSDNATGAVSGAADKVAGAASSAANGAAGAVSGAAGAATAAATGAANAVTDVAVGPTTSIDFAETEFDYGIVDEGEKVVHIYKFSNTGNEPLIISNAKGSCGCTVPEWPKEPIAPGKTGEIKVQFDSKGKPGKQRKTVTLTANTQPTNTTLVIKGEVKKAAEAKK